MRIKGTVITDKSVLVIKAIVAVCPPFWYCSAMATTVAAGDMHMAITGARNTYSTCGVLPRKPEHIK